MLRPIVMEELGKELTRNNFADIIADYENEHGEIEGMYREPRGSIYHPHSGEVIPLGTLNVEDYERPAWLFHKVVYIEKEGLRRGAQGRPLGRASRRHGDVLEGHHHPRREGPRRPTRRARRAGDRVLRS